ncbi:MAG: endonuclease/exonuclease/phosphatase family protein, partial [Candidatus Methylacidiphilales bacterium]
MRTHLLPRVLVLALHLALVPGLQLAPGPGLSLRAQTQDAKPAPATSPASSPETSVVPAAALPPPPPAHAPSPAVPTLRVCCWNLKNFGVTDQLYKGRRFKGMKPEEEVQAICALVQKLKPDVLAVQEIISADNDIYLLLLQQRLKEAGVDFPHVTTARGGDSRIQSALLSRLPFLSVAHRPDDTYEVLRRSSFPQDAPLANNNNAGADTEILTPAKDARAPTVPLNRSTAGLGNPASPAPAGSAGGVSTTTAILLLNRALLHAVVEPAPGHKVHMLVAHLKSRRAAPVYDDPATGLKGDEVMRRGEAAVLRRAMLEAAGPGETELVLAMGDMNDSPNNMPIRAIMGPRPARGVAPAWQMLPLSDYLGDTWTSFHAPGDTYNRHDYMIANTALLTFWDAGASFLYRQKESDVP